MIQHRAALIVASILILGATLGKSLQYLHWNLEDSYIVYRIVRNILAGDGWAFNPGEIHNASTSVLNTVLITIVALFGVAVPVGGHLVSGISIALAGFSTYFLFSREFSKPFAILSAVVVCVSMSENLSWGLETNLFLGLALLFILNYRHERCAWIILGFATLARPDAVLLAAIYGIAQTVRSRRIPIRGPALFLAILAPWITFSLIEFGQIFPNTLSNKIWQGNSGFWGPGLVYLRGLGDHLLSGSAFYRAQLGLALVGALWAIVARHPVVILLGSVALQQGSYVALNVPAYHWYFGALDFAVVLAFLWAMGSILSAVLRKLPVLEPIALPVITVGMAGFIAAKGLIRGLTAPNLDSGNRHYEAAMSLIERSNLPPGPVAAVEVGTVGYLTSRPILDLTGLTSVNPEFLSGIHLDRFFAHPPPLVIFHIPIWGMERALYQDPRFRYIYGQGIEIPTPYLPLQYFVAQRTAQDLTEANLQTYISANFQVFTRTSAEQNSQRPTGKAECVLDAINEFPKGERRFPINRLSLLSIRGWGVDRTAPGIDTEVQLQLLGESGDSFSATASRSPRPDVAKALAHPDYLMAGFVGEYDVQPLKPGIYFLKIFLRRGDSTLECAEIHEQLTFQ